MPTAAVFDAPPCGVPGKGDVAHAELRGVCSGAVLLWLQLAMQVDEDSIDAVLGPLLLLALICGVGWVAYRRWRVRGGATRWNTTEATIQGEFSAIFGTAGAGALGGGLAPTMLNNLWNAVLQYSYHYSKELQCPDDASAEPVVIRVPMDTTRDYGHKFKAQLEIMSSDGETLKRQNGSRLLFRNIDAPAVYLAPGFIA